MSKITFKHANKIIFILLLLNSTFCVYADKEKKIFLVTAKATKSKIVDYNENKYPNAAIYPLLFRFTFKDVKVQFGPTEKFPKTVKFDILASSDYEILNAGRVSLLINATDPDKYILLGLENLKSFVCYKEKLMDELYKDIYFDISFESNKGKKCIIITNNYFTPDYLE